MLIQKPLVLQDCAFSRGLGILTDAENPLFTSKGSIGLILLPSRIYLLGGSGYVGSAYQALLSAKDWLSVRYDVLKSTILIEPLCSPNFGGKSLNS